MIVVELILLLVSLSLVVMGVIAVLNAITLPRLGKGLDSNPVEREESATLPLISILVPMRDEADVIANSVRAWLAQDDRAFEVLILDDASSDGSAEAARKAAKGDPRLTVIAGKPLPEGWTGKNWACHQLSEAASGEVLVFTDADVQWMPVALRHLRAAMDNTGADVYTVWPTQHTVTWAERLLVPMMALAIVGYLPAPAVHNLPWASLAAANGQCLAFRRAAYEKVGGHTYVRSQIVEDVVLARQAKRLGLRLRMADGAGLILCRMYRDWTSVRDGFAKNILTGHGGAGFLLLSALFHWLVFIFPWVWLVIGWIGGYTFRYPIWALALAATGLALRGLTAAVTRQRVGDAFLMPVSVVLMTLVAGQALRWRWSGGPAWKGRTYPFSKG
jgi:chlorobactene glucosyltransferase